VSESFAALEAQVAKLSSTGEYCYGTSVSMADVCLVPQVYNARRFDCDLEPYPRLTAIADALAETDAFARAAPERQPDAQ
jgi:maleylpyruvate isomerase